MLHTDWFISLCSTLIGLSQSAPPTPVGAWSEDPDEMLQEWKTSRDWLSRELTIDSVNEENTKSEKRVSKLLSPLQLSFSQIFIQMLFTILLYLQYSFLLFLVSVLLLLRIAISKLLSISEFLLSASF